MQKLLDYKWASLQWYSIEQKNHTKMLLITENYEKLLNKSRQTLADAARISLHMNQAYSCQLATVNE